MPVVEQHTNRIDLSHQEGAVDASVLEHVRHALHMNRFFHHLDLSYNILDDECISVLCTIIKDTNHLKTFSLVSCGITDRMLSFQLVPALCTSGAQVQLVDLSKNDRITDKGVDAICQLLRASNLLELRLSGTQIGPKNAKRLLKVLESNHTLEHLELPFTVGYEVLNRVKPLLHRNLRGHKDMHRSTFATTSLPATHAESNVLRGSFDHLGLSQTHPTRYNAREVLSSFLQTSQKPALTTFTYPQTNLPVLTFLDDAIAEPNSKPPGPPHGLADSGKSLAAMRETAHLKSSGNPMLVSTLPQLKQRTPYWRQHLQAVYETLNVREPESFPYSVWADPAIARSLKHLCVLEKHHKPFFQR